MDSPSRSGRGRLLRAALLILIAFLLGAGAAALLVRAPDEEREPPLARFCELSVRLEATKAALGAGDEVFEASVAELEENLAQQSSLQERILGAAPDEIRGSLETVAAFDAEFVPLLLGGVGEAGSLRDFVAEVEAAGGSASELGSFFGFPEERVAAYNAALGRVQRYTAATCDGTPGAPAGLP